jgi:hypothetical protein
LLVTVAVVGVVMGFLAGWLEAGNLLAGVVEAALVAVALGVAFALFARLFPPAPRSVDGLRPRGVEACTATPRDSPGDCAKERSTRAESHDGGRDDDREV